MKNNFLKIALIVISLVIISPAKAAGLEEYFFASGKIRVVIAVAAIVLLGLITYVIMLDRKVSKLEKRNKES
jgi:membrane protein YdbS with pleckstrin-like domain